VSRVIRPRFTVLVDFCPLSKTADEGIVAENRSAPQLGLCEVGCYDCGNVSGAGRPGVDESCVMGAQSRPLLCRCGTDRAFRAIRRQRSQLGLSISVIHERGFRCQAGRGIVSNLLRSLAIGSTDDLARYQHVSTLVLLTN
jgi:hypothetical protein